MMKTQHLFVKTAKRYLNGLTVCLTLLPTVALAECEFIETEVPMAFGQLTPSMANGLTRIQGKYYREFERRQQLQARCDKGEVTLAFEGIPAGKYWRLDSGQGLYAVTVNVSGKQTVTLKDEQGKNDNSLPPQQSRRFTLNEEQMLSIILTHKLYLSESASAIANGQIQAQGNLLLSQ